MMTHLRDVDVHADFLHLVMVAHSVPVLTYLVLILCRETGGDARP